MLNILVVGIKERRILYPRSFQLEIEDGLIVSFYLLRERGDKYGYPLYRLQIKDETVNLEIHPNYLSNRSELMDWVYRFHFHDANEDDPVEEVITVGEWLLFLLIAFIPVVNIAYVLTIWILTKKRSLKNFITGLFLVVIIYSVVVLSGFLIWNSDYMAKFVG